MTPEDYEFFQKLGAEFGNSSSHPNFFGGFGEAMNCCNHPDLDKGGSSSSRYSRDFDDDDMSHPHLLSIFQSKEQLNQPTPNPYGSGP